MPERGGTRSGWKKTDQTEVTVKRLMRSNNEELVLRAGSSNKILHVRDVALGYGTEFGDEVRITLLLWVIRASSTDCSAAPS